MVEDKEVEKGSEQVYWREEKKVTVTKTFILTGLDCGCSECSVVLQRKIPELSGVVKYNINLPAAKMTVEFDPNKLTPHEIIRTVEESGFGAREEKGIQSASFVLTGLDCGCAECSILLQKKIPELDGVLKADINVPAARMTVEYDPNKIETQEIVKTVESVGFGAKLLGSKERFAERVPFWKNIRFILTSVGLIAFSIGMILEIAEKMKIELASETVMHLFFLIATFAGGYYVFKGGLFSLRNRLMDMNLLIRTPWRRPGMH